VSEPFAQGRAWREVARPLAKRQHLLAASARPEAVNGDAIAV
jgi:hypothetical protein